MTFNYKNITLCVLCAFLLAACGPKKEMENKKEQEQTQSGCGGSAPSQAPEKKQETPLTPEQKEELEINEDNVMNPFPG